MEKRKGTKIVLLFSQAGASSTKRATVPTSRNRPIAARRSKRMTSKVTLTKKYIHYPTIHHMSSPCFCFYETSYFLSSSAIFFLFLLLLLCFFVSKFYSLPSDKQSQNNWRIVWPFFFFSLILSFSSLSDVAMPQFSFHFSLFLFMAVDDWLLALDYLSLFCWPCTWMLTLRSVLKKNPKEWWIAVRLSLPKSLKVRFILCICSSSSSSNLLLFTRKNEQTITVFTYTHTHHTQNTYADEDIFFFLNMCVCVGLGISFDSFIWLRTHVLPPTKKQNKKQLGVNFVNRKGRFL